MENLVFSHSKLLKPWISWLVAASASQEEPKAAPEMALRKLLEVDFEHFCGLLPKWLSGGLWRLILSISGPCSRDGSQEPLEVR